MNKWLLLSVFAAVLALTACAGAPPQSATPTAAATVTPAAGGEGEAPAELLDQVVKAAAGDMGVDAAQVRIVSIEPVQWPDGCLGVNLMERPCSAGVVPGYKFLLEVDGKQVEYHTNADGTQIVPATLITAPTPQSGIDAVNAAIEKLAAALGVDGSQVQVANVEAMQWRNGCLELEQPGQMCTQVIVPGYLIVLAVNGQQYEFHTNENGTQVIAKTPLTGDRGTQDVVLTWHREGGIAGFCDELQVVGNGDAVATSCKGEALQERGRSQLDAAQQAQLNEWLNTLAPIDYTMKDPATADAMTQRLTLAGKGQAKASQEQINSLLDWSANLYTAAISSPPPTGSAAPALQIEPTAGPLKGSVVLSGSNWPPGTQIAIHLAAANVAFDAAAPLATAVAGGFGDFKLSIDVPAAWPDGRDITEQTVTWVASSANGALKATADYQIAP